MSAEVKNRGITGPTKNADVLQFVFKMLCGSIKIRTCLSFASLGFISVKFVTLCPFAAFTQFATSRYCCSVAFKFMLNISRQQTLNTPDI